MNSLLSVTRALSKFKLKECLTFRAEVGLENADNVIVVLVSLGVRHVDVGPKGLVREEDVNVQVLVASYGFILVKNLFYV
jgi:hypothetical protein